ncbi:thrombospondin type 3 repeat-containing protein [Catellatospora sichuanensis]|uniref:thrombospondin type 3 repeat-containing protein n=1 Tax=Catellatospora sichuanensis TaxID=1969805 RepID=UPI001183CD0F|nr:thrombospondin type 3 repeat-containing protein [Catellatospora sichuanensis]
MLEEASDSDSDGITDADETALGSDPHDPASRPESKELFEHAIARKLPSFEQHLTELVALPQTTAGGEKLATGLGLLDVPAKGTYLASVDGLLQNLQANGFNVGTNMTLRLPRKPSITRAERVLFAGRGNLALWGAATDGIFDVDGIYGATNYGPNGRSTPDGFTDGGFTFGDGGVLGHRYSVTYDDGSRDDVFTSTGPPGRDHSTMSTGVDSYDGNGKRAGTTIIVTQSSETRTETTIGSEARDEDGNVEASGVTHASHTVTNNADGSTFDITVSVTTNYDKDGSQTDKTTSSTTVVTHPDGTTTTTTGTTTYGDDDTVDEETETTTTTEPDGTSSTATITITYDEEGEEEGTETTEGCVEDNDCPEDAGDGTDEAGYTPDPDYAGVPVITAEDMARVIARLNSTRNPDPDSGGVDPRTGEIDISDVIVPAGGYDPTIALVHPDGVVTIAVGGTPSFNRTQPRYGNDLNVMVDLAGIHPPNNDTDPVSWPS